MRADILIITIVHSAGFLPLPVLSCFLFIRYICVIIIVKTTPSPPLSHGAVSDYVGRPRKTKKLNGKKGDHRNTMLKLLSQKHRSTQTHT